jgi:hypothetical protein
MAVELQSPVVSIVLLGSFDPSAATPEKLGAADVIRPDEAAAAKFRTLVAGQVCDYVLDWVTVAVSREQFVVEATVPPFVRILDLVRKTLAELMPHSQINRMGINCRYGIRFGSFSDRNDFGTRLVPTSGWGHWGRRVQHGITSTTSESELHGGVVLVTMRERPVPHRRSGWRDVQVTAPLGPGADAQIALNDHFESVDPEFSSDLEPQEVDGRRTSAFLRTLEEQFERTLTELDVVAKDIIHG